MMKTTFFLLFGLLLSVSTAFARPPLSAEERENVQIYERASPAVVNISSIAIGYDFFYRAIPSEAGSGTGFLIDKDGHIVTNYHVIEGAQELMVTLLDESRWNAQVVGVDPNSDLAVIRIDAPAERLRSLELADSEEVFVGQKVLALGNPFGLQHTLTTGIVSALGRTIEAQNGRKIEGVLQTDAAINPGNSGGPLLNTQGQVIGINTAIIGSAGSVGIGFAIPSNTAQRLIPDLIAYGYVQRPWLGVEPIPTRYLNRAGLNLPEGLLLANVVAGESAALAGLRGASREIIVGRYRVPWGGDIITHINDAPVTSLEQLAQQIENRSPGDTVRVTYIRERRTYRAEVQLTQKPQPMRRIRR
jgi:S1-C subfamily serine protease